MILVPPATLATLPLLMHPIALPRELEGSPDGARLQLGGWSVRDGIVIVPGVGEG
jgi:hypothetical protein